MTEALPEELFVIVTRDANPIVKWNMSLGRIASAGLAYAEQNPETYAVQRDEWLPWIPNPNYNTFVGFHSLRVSSDMRAEYNAELSRIRYFKDLPSRLACLYTWGSIDDAVRARTTMRGRFIGTILQCRPVKTLRSARCNSALVNFAQRGERGGFFTDQASVDQIWRTYWSGSSEVHMMERPNMLDPSGPPEKLEMSAEPLWEWLIDGALEIVAEVTPPTTTHGTAT
ncbi:hypothetical protein PA27867_2093 [Cryobacterium arcticum]|uniref:Uncharacterized protein n=1 Tax=Cryobacterium arcticum TaxID=670052 RepID=A0A1B1BKG6_9MICO|nr:hypothetical protein PA27867_2093 [Cryobacterium arcticum]